MERQNPFSLFASLLLPQMEQLVGELSWERKNLKETSVFHKEPLSHGGLLLVQYQQTVVPQGTAYPHANTIVRFHLLIMNIWVKLLLLYCSQGACTQCRLKSVIFFLLTFVDFGTGGFCLVQKIILSYLPHQLEGLANQEGLINKYRKKPNPFLLCAI